VSQSRAAGSATVTFSSRLAFVFAAVGAAVGLGNVWKFPYLAGENGGAAFVLVYLAGLALVALPIFIAEVVIGRRGAASPPEALRRQAVEHGRSPHWRVPGLFGLFAGLVIMSFYSVVAGWTFDYLLHTADGTLSGLSPDRAVAHFEALQASLPRLFFWQGVFILLTLGIVAKGVTFGIERAVGIMTPALGVLLLVLVGYAIYAGDVSRAVAYLFAPDFAKLTPRVMLAAVGQAFFTLSVGIGGVMMYGAYLPRGASILRLSGYVALADTAVALLAGVAVFPIVFANGLDPAGGPGLVFVTLPLAFADMPLGALVGAIFFFFLILAALTSSIALYEPTVAWLAERGVKRGHGVLVAAGLSWLFGIASVLSFNLWRDWHPLGFVDALAGATPFDLITRGIDVLVLPLGALVIACFAGRLLPMSASRSEFGPADGRGYWLWRFAVRWLTPALILVLLLANIF